jgi:hypothetical protein
LLISPRSEVTKCNSHVLIHDCLSRIHIFNSEFPRKLVRKSHQHTNDIPGRNPY